MPLRNGRTEPASRPLTRKQESIGAAVQRYPHDTSLWRTGDPESFSTVTGCIRFVSYLYEFWMGCKTKTKMSSMVAMLYEERYGYQREY